MTAALRLLYRHGHRGFLLINVPCTVNECDDYGRMFDMDHRQLPSFLNTTLSAAFFDISEDVTSFVIYFGLLCSCVFHVLTLD